MTHNAILLAVTAPGGTAVDDYGDPVTDGAAVWGGRLPGTLQTEQRQVVSGGQTTNVDTDVLTVLGGRRLPEIVPGEGARASTVVVDDRRTLQPFAREYRVIGVERDVAGSSVDSVRLQLEEVDGG